MVSLVNENQIKKQENRIFFSQWVKNPVQLGTFAPISEKLANNATICADINPEMRIVELGAGTGRLTRSLLRAGADSSKLALVELDAPMCQFLTNSLGYLGSAMPKIICGDASKLETILPEEYVDSTDIIVSVLPLMFFPIEIREKIIEAAFRVLKPGGRIIHVSYNPKSALTFMNNINQRLVYSTWLNFPPGFVWEFSRPDLQLKAA
jgi:phosphatidylethanolamine/phosphatidyl-N-methylethanolamine N-methyltransferase